MGTDMGTGTAPPATSATTSTSATLTTDPAAAKPQAWTLGKIEPPQGEEDMGTYTTAVYTPEQQARLVVDKQGKPSLTGESSIYLFNIYLCYFCWFFGPESPLSVCCCVWPKNQQARRKDVLNVHHQVEVRGVACG